DGDDPATLDVPRLATGEHATLTFAAQITAPTATITAEGAHVLLAGTVRAHLPARTNLATMPLLAPPEVTLVPGRRHAGVTVTVRNDGWADAPDVPIDVGLPPGARLIVETAAADGVPVVARARRAGALVHAGLERSRARTTFTLARVPARDTVRLAFMVAFPNADGDGTIRIVVGEHTQEAPLAAASVREIRLRALDVPAVAAPGARLRLRALVFNAGDATESLRLTIGDDDIATVAALRPGGLREVDLVAQVPSRTLADAVFRASIVASDEHGERARATFAVAMREAIALPAAVVDDARESSRPAIRAAIAAPSEGVAGAPFTVRLDVEIDGAVETLTLRIPTPPGARAIAGSAAIDGFALLDEGGRPPFDGDGLLVRGVLGTTTLAATCAFAADARPSDTDLLVAADLLADGVVVPLVPMNVRVRASAAFAERPVGLAFHVDARIACSPPPEPPAPSEAIESPVMPDNAAADDDAFTFVVRLDDERREQIGRLLDGIRGPGLVGHVMVVRAFFPDNETSGDLRVAEALGGTVEAVGDLFDRLFVKLRIPGFEVTADDLDDVIVRRSLVALFAALRIAPGGRPARTDAPCTRLSRERIAELAEAIERAPYGAPAALRALVALLPTRCDGEPALGDALLRYALAIDDALARCEGVPLERFDHALAHRSDAMLDDARAALISALRSRATVGTGVC
ncbi:MAG: hypothetical protein JOZ86_11345, partial [Candidatus Eremiobacteraeota bacterium]|nr:hypothetical protein [Candidatus Eremiobacteraeota bacterium]